MIGFGSKRTHDSRAVVTGAGSGIGEAFALELAKRGGSVVCSDIDVRTAQATADRITEAGGKAVALACDVSSLEQVTALAQDAQEWFGGVPTLVVNNAGVGAGGQLVGETPWADWEWTLGINLYGVIHGCHTFVPMMREAGQGGVINVASAAAFSAAPRMAQYNVSKAGVMALSETLSAELAGSGVGVTVLCPTFVKTNILTGGRITSASTELAAKLMAFGMSPERVARTTLNTHDRGGLYVMPQLDAKAVWAAKRHTPRTYTRGVGLLDRFTSLGA
ncbi:SDR family NAD(P)-dependent oxidoreductase [Aeromicrobium marinum]|nr:SDR family NAD(P)-dependent oxidoreductase [Aeromicrobium marinum]